MNLVSYLGGNQIVQLAQLAAQFAVPLSLGAGAAGITIVKGNTASRGTLMGTSVTLCTGAASVILGNIKGGMEPVFATATKLATLAGSALDLGNDLILSAKEATHTLAPHAGRLIVSIIDYGADHPAYLYTIGTALSVGAAAATCLKLAKGKGYAKESGKESRNVKEKVKDKVKANKDESDESLVLVRVEKKEKEQAAKRRPTTRSQKAARLFVLS